MSLLRRALIAAGLAAALLGPSAAHGEMWEVRKYPQLGKPSANVKLRAGPGSFFPQLDTIRRGELIVVRSCNKGWCQITQQDNGPIGFMTDAYLIFMGEIHG